MSVENQKDGLRHFEKDMAELMTVMKDKITTEIVLNPYKNPDGTYEGHILVKQHGRELDNLFKFEELVMKPVTLDIDDSVLIKYDKDFNDILFWVKISNEKEIAKISILEEISVCIRNEFANDNLIGQHVKQSHNSHLLQFATHLRNGYLHNVKIDLSELEYLDEFIHSLNAYLSPRYSINLKHMKIKHIDELNQFKPYPEKIIKTEIVKMTTTKAEAIMSTLASITGKIIHTKTPDLECQIPKYGHRFTGVIPPASDFPAFCIRKHSPKIFTLDDYVRQGVMEESSKETITRWINRKFNILIAGGTNTGKTTLANAILYEINRQFPNERIVIIEDTKELQFDTSRSLSLTTGEFYNMYDGLRTTLRFIPNRIVMGEVRGAEAYTLLKAWNTGHPGGLATIHANGILSALARFESCVRDHKDIAVNKKELGFTINGIISIQNITVKETDSDGNTSNAVRRKITGLRQIIEYDPDKDIYADVRYDVLPENFDD
jgi:P-type conjugative transfer ATPase TrbB